MNFSVGRKLFLAFAFIVVVIITLSIINSMNMKSINSKSHEIVSTWIPAVKSLGDIKYNVQRVVTNELFHSASNTVDSKKVFEDELIKSIENLEVAFTNYENLISMEEEVVLFEQLKKDWNWYLKIHVHTIEASNANDSVKARDLIRSGSSQLSIVEETLNELIEVSEEAAYLARMDGERIFKTATTISVVFLVLAIMSSILIGVLLTRKISKPLVNMANNAKLLADGNLVVQEIKSNNHDELGDLAKNFNVMTDNLRMLISSVAKHSEIVSNTSTELTENVEGTSKVIEGIAVSIQEVAVGSDNQVAHLFEANQLTENISNEMKKAAISIKQVTDIAFQSSENAKIGNEVVKETIKQMNFVQNKVNTTSVVVNELGEKSNNIGSIVTLITDVASQTNLLALNAAIEAKRAGIHGRGFSVVADEVRKLADTSTQAAKKIEIILEEIQLEIKSAIVTMNEGALALDEGIIRIGDTGDSFQGIVGMVDVVAFQSREVSHIVEQVRESSLIMVNKINEVSNISKQTDESTQLVAASIEEQHAQMEEIASSANELSNMGLVLKRAINKFTI
ncbi:methyl-accepting chemotaxis protein [Bacillus solitudinis]|uniref:methyl-accepting chemotaxis protein n=1 Tax=Bacillus solitudinis TaxID=2014074 RepID=UPI000C249B13|nr:methyl-accepting chemotaxis protein [Bacillus solitudinis]